MDAAALGRSRFLNLLFRIAGMTMESRLRGWLMPPGKTLQGAGLKSGQTVLEVGSGTGFFTLPAAAMIGEGGHLIALEPLSDFADKVEQKVRQAGYKNVEVIKRDGLRTELDPASIDVVLLFGVIPFPTLPLKQLLPEMHRVLKAEGTLAVWLFPTSGGVPTAILKSGLFSDQVKTNGVYTYRPSPTEPPENSHRQEDQV